jgi:hypothetical protein
MKVKTAIITKYHTRLMRHTMGGQVVLFNIKFSLAIFKSFYSWL